MRVPRFPRYGLCLAGIALASISGWAATISGTVTNRTNQKPAAGDDVVLIRLAQGMQEAERTKTDAIGHYSLQVNEEGLHLIRVTHDKANYFRAVPAGTRTVDVDVFNAAAKVKGIAAEADVMRLQTDASGGSLRVVENFFLKNDSDPPMTQFGPQPFDFYLPPGSVVEGSAAMAPGGMAVQASPVPLGDANHYAFIFPIRPGETRFQITYHLPYSGTVSLRPRPSLSTDTVAVMMPKSMQFRPSSGAPYTAVSDEVNAQTFVARQVQPSQELGFAVSGSGQLPRDTQVSPSDSGQSDAGPAPADGSPASASPDKTKFGGGLGNPVDPGALNDPWAKYRWWILGGLGLALATGAGVLLRKRPEQGVSLEAPPSTSPRTGFDTGSAEQNSSLAVLKEELFQIESDKLRGFVDESEYREIKSALETLLRRIMRRSGAFAPVGKAGTPELSGSGHR